MPYAATPNPGFRHLIIKQLKNKEEGLEKVNLLKEIGITYICGGYELGNNKDLHAHFLIHSQYDRRYVGAHCPFENRFTFTKNEHDKTTTIVTDEVDIKKIISYTLKDGNTYEYNDNQQFYDIPNYEELKQQAAEKRKKYVNPDGKPKSATQKLIQHFRDLPYQWPLHMPNKHKAIVSEILKYSRENHKLIDEHIIYKQTCSILNDQNPEYLETVMWDKIKYRFNQIS